MKKMLYVYRMGESMPCWYAEFKTDKSILEKIKDYSVRGFVCKIEVSGTKTAKKS